MKKIILFTVSLIFSSMIFAQDNVGIGTLTPNSNAILDLEADDKGLLIPRLTTAERTALNPGFGAAETGMLVFDTNDTLFYFWDGTAWIAINGSGINTDDQNLTLSNDTLFIEDGNFVVITDDVNDADFDPTNELQDMSVVGDSILISGGTSIFLGDVTNTSIANDSLLIINGDTINLAAASVGSDDQALSISGDTLLLEDGGFVLLQNLTSTNLFNDSVLVINGDTVNLSTNDADFDPTNEIQNISVVGDSLLISGGTSIALADITTTTISNDSLLIINGDTINLAAAAVGSDDQALTLSNDTLFLEDGGFVVLTDNVNDADFDPTNEIQNISVVGDSLLISGGTSIALADITTTTISNDSLLIINGDTINLAVAAVGSDDQALTISNDTLFLEDGGFAVLPSSSTNNTLDQAYDQGGPGIGREILATDGAVQVNGTDGLYVSGTLSSGSAIELSGAGTRMFFNPRLASFRAGNVDGTQWDLGNVGIYSFASGFNNQASGDGSVAMGRNNNASNIASIALGGSNISSGGQSIAMGNQTVSSGLRSFTVGFQTTASGNEAIAMGNNTVASGNNSLAIGNQTVSSGVNSFTTGLGTLASGNQSIAFGNATTASGVGSTAIGSQSIASGLNAIAIGNSSAASGNESVALGVLTNAIGDISLTTGLRTRASGYASSAFGRETVASGNHSTATGYFSNAQSFNETVIGLYNDTLLGGFNALGYVATDRLFTVGNGFDNANRSNAMVVLKNGNTGIGRSNPQANLHVESQNLVGDAEIIIEADRDNNNEQDNPVLTFIQDGGLISGSVGLEGNAGTKATNTLGNALVIENTTTAVQVATGGAVRTTVTAGGDVGIGTVTPLSQLQVGAFSDLNDNYVTVATSGGNVYRSGIKLRHFSEGFGWNMESDEITSKFSIKQSFNPAFTDSSRLTIDFFGQVGIATENPSQTLDVNGAIHVAQETTTPAPNVVYGNSMPLAYGIFGPAGTQFSTYGITSITNTSAGQYTIVLDNAWVGSATVIANLYDLGNVGFINCFANFNSNIVTVYTYNASGVLENRQTSFVVHGTPQ